jgi:hypothetical protein
LVSGAAREAGAAALDQPMAARRPVAARSQGGEIGASPSLARVENAFRVGARRGNAKDGARFAFDRV